MASLLHGCISNADLGAASGITSSLSSPATPHGASDYYYSTEWVSRMGLTSTTPIPACISRIQRIFHLWHTPHIVWDLQLGLLGSRCLALSSLPSSDMSY